MSYRSPLSMVKLRRGILLSVVLLMLTACKIELYTNLNEREANEMLAILLQEGVDAQKKPGKKDFVGLFVGSDEMAKSINILKSYGYPREEFLDVCDIFEKKGLISSPMEERVRFVCAIQQGLSETLSQLDGVIVARVHVVLPETDVAGEEVIPSSASIFIKYSTDAKLQAFIPQIKLLVNNSIEGLDYGRISVALFPAETLTSDSFDKPWAPSGVFEAGNKSLLSDGKTVYIGLGLLAIILLSIAANVFFYMRSRKN